MFILVSISPVRAECWYGTPQYTGDAGWTLGAKSGNCLLIANKHGGYINIWGAINTNGPMTLHRQGPGYDNYVSFSASWYVWNWNDYPGTSWAKTTATQGLCTWWGSCWTPTSPWASWP